MNSAEKLMQQIPDLLDGKDFQYNPVMWSKTKRLIKAIKLAWKYRKLYRELKARRCEDCRYFDFNICSLRRPKGDEWYVPNDAQCPRWEGK